MTPKPFTVAALALRWECSPDFVYDQIRQGRLNAIRLGGKLLRISVDEVERWESAGGSMPTGGSGSASSKAKPSPSGGTNTGPNTDTALKRGRSLKADLRLMRLSESATD